MKATDKVLQRIKMLVLQSEPSAKIYLYGSRARGTAKLDSDWDLLILLNKDRITNEEEQKITYPLYDLEFEIGEVISPMVYSENEWYSKYRITPFYSNVMREGRLL
ncbi:MAG: nucleotidyltransferase domain-containing protein [Salinivirgaceae bacterium]